MCCVDHLVNYKFWSGCYCVAVLIQPASITNTIETYLSDSLPHYVSTKKIGGFQTCILAAVPSRQNGTNREAIVLLVACSESGSVGQSYIRDIKLWTPTVLPFIYLANHNAYVMNLRCYVC